MRLNRPARRAALTLVVLAGVAFPAATQPSPSWTFHIEILAPLVDPRDRDHIEWGTGDQHITATVIAPDAESGWNRVGRLRLLLRTIQTTSGARLVRFGVGTPVERRAPGGVAWSVQVRGKLDAGVMKSVWPTGRVVAGGDTLDASALFHPTE